MVFGSIYLILDIKKPTTVYKTKSCRFFMHTIYVCMLVLYIKQQVCEYV